MPRNLGEAFVGIHPDAGGFRAEAVVKIKQALAGVNPEVGVKLKVDRSSIGQFLSAAQKAANIEANVSTDKARAQIDFFSKRISALSEEMSHLHFDGDDKALSAKIATFNSRIYDMAEKLRNLTMAGDTSKLDAAIARESANLEVLRRKASSLKLTADDTAAIAQIANLDLRIERLATRMEKMPEFSLQADAAQATLDAMLSKVELLRADAANAIKLDADKVQITTAITASEASIAALKQQAADISIGFSPGDLLKMHADITGLEADAGKLKIKTAESLLSEPAAATPLYTPGNKGLFGRFGGVLGGKTALFGGAFGAAPVVGAATGLHILASGVGETLAALIPATVALTAFGIAGAGAAKDIFTHMQNVTKAASALGVTVPGLTDSFSKLQDAAKPHVLELFGIGVATLNTLAGRMTGTVDQTGNALTNLAARASAALTSGGFSTFLAQGPHFVTLLGTIVGNIFGIIGNLLRSLPGYATAVFGVIERLTHGLENLTSSGWVQDIIKGGLSFHGLVLYAGLAVTAVAYLGNAVVGLGVKMGLLQTGSKLFDGATFASSLRQVATGSALTRDAMAGMTEAEILATGATGRLAGAMDLLKAAAPVLILTAIATAGYLIYREWSSAGSAVSKYSTDAQNALGAASLQDFPKVVAQQTAIVRNDISRTTKDITASFAAVKPHIDFGGVNFSGVQSFNTSLRNMLDLTAKVALGTSGLSSKQIELVKNWANEQAALGPLQAAGKNYSTVLKDAGGSLAILNLAGISSKDIMDASTGSVADQASKMAILEAKAKGAASQITALGYSSDQTGNFVHIMDAQATSFYTTMQNINSAIDTFISNVTASPLALNSIFQGANTIADQALTSHASLSTAQGNVASAQNTVNNMQAAGTTNTLAYQAATDKLTAAQAKLTLVQQDQGATIGGSTAASVTLTSSYYGQIDAINKWADSLRLSGISQTETTDAIKAALGPMLSLAGNSSSARDSIYALAYSAGYRGVDSIKALSDWVGKLGGNQATMQQATADATNAMLKQTTQAKDLSAAINTNLNAAFATAIAQAYNLGPALNQLAQDFVTHQRPVAEFTNDMFAAGTAILHSSANAGDAKAKFEAFAGQMGLTKDQADKLWQSFLNQTAIQQLENHLSESKTKFEDYAKSIGLTKQQADDLWNTLKNPPPNPVIKITVEAQLLGTGTIKATDNILGGATNLGELNFGSSTAPVLKTALGGKLPGYGGGDQIPILAEGGEAIVSKETTRKYASVLRAMGVPGMQQGGILAPVNNVLNSIGPTAGNWTSQFAQGVSQEFAKAVRAQQVSTSQSRLGLNNLPLGSGPASGSAGIAQQFAKSIMWAYGWGQDQWPYLQALWNRESGWNAYAANPTSNARGIPQSISGWASYAPGDYQAQDRWGEAYISGRYGNPAGAWKHELAQGWYSQGGLVGYAGGGIVKQLASEQAQERYAYTVLTSAFRHGPFGKRISDELGTLGRRQAAEQAAYQGLSGAGLTTAHLSHFAALAREEARTSQDQALVRAHQGDAGALHSILEILAGTKIGAKTPPLLSPVALLRSELAAAQKTELSGYLSFVQAFGHKPSAGIKNELGILNRQQRTEEAAYSAVGRWGGLTQGGLNRLANAAGTESLTALKRILQQVHPARASALNTDLLNVFGIATGSDASSALSAETAQILAKAQSGLLSFDLSHFKPLNLSKGTFGADSGTVLSPGWNARYNGTGRPETLVPPQNSGQLSADTRAILAGLNQLTKAVEENTAVTSQQAAQVGRGLSGTLHRAGSRGAYQP